MRMFFAPDESQEYEAARGLLVRRFQEWAGEQGLEAEPFIAEAALDYRHRNTPDGRLGLWTQRHVEEFLLEWLPRTVTVLPDEEPFDAQGTLRALLRYLDAVQLTDPRGASLAENLAAVDDAAPRHAEAMADRSRWGMSKFWATTAAEQGVDLHDDEAVQRFMEQAQLGEVDIDHDALEAIVQRQYTEGDPDAHRAEPQTPVESASEEVLREQAERSPVLGRLRGIAEWAGRQGRVLTSTGRLKLADARTLARELDTGDPTAAPVRSSAELPELNLLVEWAKKARLVRVVKGRLYAVAKAEPVLKDSLALWRRAFEAFLELDPMVVAGKVGWGRTSLFSQVYEEVLPDVLATLYGLPYAMPWPRLRDSVHLVYRSLFELDSLDTTAIVFEAADRDLQRVLGLLEELGAVQRHEGVADPVFLQHPLEEDAEEDEEEHAEEADEEQDWKKELTAGPVTLIRFTELGTDSMRRWLLAEGREAPLIGELAQAPAAGLLGVLADHYDPDSARKELAGWIAGCEDPTTAVEKLTEAVRTTPFRTSAAAMLTVLVEGLDNGKTLLRSLRTDPALAPTAISVLVGRNIIGHEDVTEAENVLMVAESMLQLLETAGPEGVDMVLGEEGPRAREALAVALASDHPDQMALAELKSVAEDAPS